MKRQHQKTIVITGFAEDIRRVASMIENSSAEIIELSEKAKDQDIPRTANIVVYVMSQDTGVSTQLHSLFVCIHDRVVKAQEYLIPVEEVNLSKASFPELSALPKISTKDLKRKLAMRDNGDGVAMKESGIRED